MRRSNRGHGSRIDRNGHWEGSAGNCCSVPSAVACRMSRHVVGKNAAAADFHHHQDKQHLESDRDYNQKVTGHDSWRMIFDEGLPVLRGGSSAPALPGCLDQYFRTVRGETHMLNFNESSWAIRSSPQVMFSSTIPAMSRRISSLRPADRHAISSANRTGTCCDASR